jgi:uncharacterized membrane protein YgdD (TMEM256/DUF423 family)
MHKGFLTIAALIGALSVVFGAFGAHALKTVVNEQALAAYETAVRYQFYHVFALALAGVLYKTYPNTLLISAGRFFIGGMILFCGSLYLLTYGASTGVSFRWAGPITPVGGVFFILGWVWLALGIRKGVSS